MFIINLSVYFSPRMSGSDRRGGGGDTDIRSGGGNSRSSRGSGPLTHQSGGSSSLSHKAESGGGSSRSGVIDTRAEWKSERANLSLGGGGHSRGM